MRHASPRPSARIGRRNAGGVSRLEMLLVLALIAIVTTLAAMVLTGGLDGMRLRSSTKEIAEQLRYTRAQAIARGEPQQFEIDPAARRWQAPNDKHGKIPESLRIEFTGAREAQPRAGKGGILFFPDGGSTGGRVQLSTGSAASRIDVKWLTGEVNVSRVQSESTP